MPKRRKIGRKRGRGRMSDESYMSAERSLYQKRLSKANASMSHDMAEKAGGFKKRTKKTARKR